MENICKYNQYPLINQYNVLCLNNGTIVSNSIDETPPYINSTKQYSALMGDEKKLINQLEYGDNLSKLENASEELSQLKAEKEN